MANDPLTIQPQNLNPFDRLPEAIKDWLNSNEVLETLIAIEEQFSIRTENIPLVPLAITGLVTNKIDPKDFVSALEVALQMPRKDAETIARIIRIKILNPIEKPLKLTANIDISPLPNTGISPAVSPNSARPAASAPIMPAKPLIAGTPVSNSPAAPKPFLSQPAKPVGPVTPLSSPVAPKPAMHEPVLPPASEKSLGEQVSLGSAVPLAPLKTTPAPAFNDIKPMTPAPKTPAEAPKPAMKPEAPKVEKPIAPPAPSATTKTAPKPFMLHEEKPAAPSMTERQSFSFSIPTSTVAPKPLSAAAKPVEAQFGSAFESFGKKPAPTPPQSVRTPDQGPKIVHYSPFRTLVNPENGLPKPPDQKQEA